MGEVVWKILKDEDAVGEKTQVELLEVGKSKY